MGRVTLLRRLFPLAIAILAAACGGQEAGTYVVLDLQVGRGAPPAEGVQAIALEVDLGGKKTMTTLKKGEGAIMLPTTASLEIGQGAGPIVIVARAQDGAGAVRGTGTGMGDVKRGVVARVAVPIDFGASSGTDGGLPPGADAGGGRDVPMGADVAAPSDGPSRPDGAGVDTPPGVDMRGVPDAGAADVPAGADVSLTDAEGADGLAPLPDAPAFDLPPDSPPAPALSLDKLMHDFGNVVNNTSSTPVNFTLSNMGNAPSGTITVSLTSTPDMQYAIASDGCSGMALAGGTSCVVAVRMTPTMTGSPTATLSIGATPGGMFQASISGMSVTQGSIAIEPATRDFGSVVLGNLTDQTFTVRNVGGAPTGALTISFAGTDASQFSIPTDGCTGRVLAGGGTCALTVRFAPNSKGFKSASLTAVAAPGGSGIATVTGTALAPALLSVSPNYNDFGTMDVSMTTAPVTFTVRNDGDDLSGVPMASLGGTDMGQFMIMGTTCSAALAAGATCTVSVAFAPTTYNVKTATLAIAATPGGTAIASLRGTGRDWFAITVGTMGAGMGTVTSLDTSPAINCGATCTGNAPRTTASPTVTLTATPAASSTFDSWTGCDSVSGTTCTLTVSTARNVTATFSSRTFTLTVTKTESDGAAGTVATSAPTMPAIDCGSTCMGTYSYGTTVTLNATPSMHYFGGWGGACAGFTTCTLTMTADRAVTARFNPANKMFVTSTPYTIAAIKSMGTGATAAEQMASGADKICSNLATGASLSGTWVAYLSLSSTVTANSRLGTARGWMRVDGKAFIDSLTAPMYANQMFSPPALDQAGNPVSVATVLTASTATGLLYSSSYTCNNWMDMTNLYYTRLGISTAAAPYWATYTIGYCDGAYNLYCFQKDYTARVTPPPLPTSGRKVLFLSRNSYPNINVMGADSVCGMDASAASLSGTFKAMLATTTASIASRFTATGVPVYRPDGALVANTDTQLLSATPTILAPLNVVAAGNSYLTTYVWTGATSVTTPTPAGTPPYSCADWTTNLSGNYGYAGYTPYTTLPSATSWINYTTYPCTSSAPRFYCLQD